MQDYNDRRPQSCATFLAAKIEGFYKGWNCSSLIRPNIFSESYSSAAIQALDVLNIFDFKKISRTHYNIKYYVYGKVFFLNQIMYII